MVKRIIVPVILAIVLSAGVCFPQVAANYPGHLSRGLELYEAGNYGAARNELAKALEYPGTDAHGERTRVLYLIADCAVKLDDPQAMNIISNFLLEYPNSIYANDMKFAEGNLYYAKEDYRAALAAFLEVSPYDLQSARRDEYNFKTGYAYFSTGNYGKALPYFRQVSRTGEYTPHADYHIAYTDYIDGNYAAAKRGFAVLLSNESYSRIIPFYLLQIEFLEGNYDYVVKEGDALLASATGSRAAEISRVMAESWFHKGDYARTLEYMDIYQAAGGRMGREEYYLTGYSQYMRNDLSQAIDALSKVSGPDDKLTQNAAYHLGGAYVRTGDKRNALRSFSMAATADYEPAIREDALFNYGKLQYELGGGVFNEAINVLTRYIEEYPDSPRKDEAREYLVAAYYNSRNYQAAYEAIRMLSNPDNNQRTALQKIAYFRALEYYNAGDMDNAYHLLEEAYANRFNAKYTALTQFWRAEVLYRQGDFARAIPLYLEYLSLAPQTEREYAMAQYNLGYSYFNQKNWSEAGTWFGRFLNGYSQQDSYRADALNRRGDIQYAGREFRNAIESYDAAARIGTREKYYSQYNRAVVIGIAERPERKIEALREIINRGEGDYIPDAMYELGRTYITMERFSDGAQVLKNFADEYPSSDKYLPALADLGLAYQNLGNNSTALRYYQLLIEKAPNSSQARDAMLSVKSIYVDMNDVDGYFAFAERTGIETDTGVVARDSLTYISAERIYLQGASGRDNAARAFGDYLARFPRGAYRANALFYLADCRLQAGDTDAAIENLAELSRMHYNGFTVRGLEKLGPLQTRYGKYQDAAETYLKLSRTSVNPAVISASLSEYVKNIRLSEPDADRMLLASANILATTGASVENIREANGLRAEALEMKGDTSSALDVYRELSSEVVSAEGARARYKIIESLYEQGELLPAETMILQFAELDSPQTYWLGRAFLLLGKIYMDQGDAFQARATLQSIVDGYSPANDGIIESAKQMISEL